MHQPLGQLHEQRLTFLLYERHGMELLRRECYKVLLQNMRFYTSRDLARWRQPWSSPAAYDLQSGIDETTQLRYALVRNSAKSSRTKKYRSPFALHRSKLFFIANAVKIFVLKLCLRLRCFYYEPQNTFLKSIWP